MKFIDFLDATASSDLPTTERAVLWWMARRAISRDGELGPAWPSKADLVAGTGSSRATVTRALKALREAGWLVEHDHSRGQVLVYHLAVPDPAHDEPTEAHDEPTGAHGEPGEAHGEPGSQRAGGRLMVSPGGLMVSRGEAHGEPRKKQLKKPMKKQLKKHTQDSAPEGAVCVPPDDDPGLSGEPQGEQPREDLDNGPPKDAPRQPTLPSLPAPKPAKKADNRKPSKAIQRDEAVARCLAEWNVHAEKAWRFRHKSLPAKTRSAIAARIDEHDEASVIEVVRWWWTSKSDRASFLRTGGHELPTIVRPEKFATYLDLARQPDAPSGPWRGEHPAQQAGPEAPAKHPDILDEDEFQRMAAAFQARPSIGQELDAKLAARRGVTP